MSKEAKKVIKFTDAMYKTLEALFALVAAYEAKPINKIKIKKARIVANKALKILRTECENR